MIRWCLENPWLTFFLLVFVADALATRFSWRRKEQLLRKDMRIRQLEEILCPCEQHDWVTARYEVGENDTSKRILMCQRCKKEKEAENTYGA